MGLIDSLKTPEMFVMYMLAIVFATTIHEFAHAYFAYKFGDDDQITNKRLSLNPLRHLDPLGTLSIIFLGIGWGRPVIVNEGKINKNNWKRNFYLISLGGIIFNFLSAIFFLIMLKLIVIFNIVPLNNLVVTFFVILVNINIIFGVFNLIPIHPLDGAKVLDLTLPDRFRNFKLFLLNYGNMILFTLLGMSMIFNISVFSYLYTPVIAFMYSLFGI